MYQAVVVIECSTAVTACNVVAVYVLCCIHWQVLRATAVQVTRAVHQHVYYSLCYGSCILHISVDETVRQQYVFILHVIVLYGIHTTHYRSMRCC
jgi:hypothetical protein